MKVKKYSKIYRIMHWSIAICLILLLLTIFLRLTWMNKHHVASIIDDYLINNNHPSLSQDELIILAKEIRHPMWKWHIYLGYILTGLFTIRFMLPLWGKMKFQNPLNKSLSNHEKFQYWMYWIFYLCIVISLVTGLIIELGPKEYKKPMESIHVLSIYYLLTYLVLHIGNVLRVEFTQKDGIISRIISGGQKFK